MTWILSPLYQPSVFSSVICRIHMISVRSEIESFWNVQFISIETNKWQQHLVWNKYLQNYVPAVEEWNLNQKRWPTELCFYIKILLKKKLTYIILMPSNILDKVAMTLFLLWGQISWGSYSRIIWMAADLFNSFFNVDLWYIVQKIVWSLNTI